MNRTLGRAGAAVLGVAASVVALRVVSRRHSTACPPWLVPLLENPYMERLAGADVVLSRAGVASGMAVLDVGSGPGRLTIPAARVVGKHGRVTAVDMQRKMIERVVERAKEANLGHVDAVVCEVGKEQLPSGPFDRALLVTTLGEIVDQHSALSAIRVVLRPGGLLSVTEVIPDPHYQSRGRVRRLAEEAGFEFVEVSGSWYAFTMNLRRPAGPGT